MVRERMPVMTKAEASEAIEMAMKERGLTYAELAAQLERPRVWFAAAVLGQHPFSREEAEKLVATLDLPAEAVVALTAIPMRGALDGAVPVDPTIYRLYEAIQVYGPALKALIHEEFGDGFARVVLHFGFMDEIDVPAAMQDLPDWTPMKTSLSTRAGCATAKCCRMSVPSECPTRRALSIPSTSSSAFRSCTQPSIDSAPVYGERPAPSRS